jgi:predicted anti-sigma-YlaC factor YlaD
MNPIGCAQVRDASPELALGILDGAERAELLWHLGGCPRCQEYVNELAGVADGLTRLAPEVEPPLGFSRRVDAAIRGRHRRTFRRWGTVALAAAAAAILSVATVQIIDAGRSTPRVAAPTLHTVAMIGANNVRVGRVAVSGTSPVSLAVNVDYSIPDGAYTLELTHPGSAGQHIGTLTVAGGHGAWNGTATLPRRDDVTLQMVSGTRTVVCQAAVTQAQAT